MWLGAFAVTVVAAVAVSVPAVLLAAADQGGLALYSLAGFTIVLTAVAALVVLTSVLRMTVTVRAAAISLWATIGLSPATVRAVVTTEVLVVSALGAVGGALVGVLVAPGFVAYGLTGTVGIAPVVPHADAATAAWSALAVVLVAVPCAVGAGRRAARLSPLIAIRRDHEPPPRAGWRRPVVALALVALIASMIVALRDPQSGSQLLLIGPLLAGAVAAAGPIIVAPFVRGWTLPLRAGAGAALGAAAGLARASAVFDPRRNDATVSAAVIAIGLPAGLLAGAQTLSALSGGALSGGALSGGPAAGTAPAVALLVGGPTVLAATAAAVSAAMGTAARVREQAAVRAAGADESTAVAVAALETAIHAVTAAVAVAIVLVVAAAAESVALGSAVAGVGLPALAAATLGVLVATVGASALVAWRGIRRPVPDVLAVR